MNNLKAGFGTTRDGGLSLRVQYVGEADPGSDEYWNAQQWCLPFRTVSPEYHPALFNAMLAKHPTFSQQELRCLCESLAQRSQVTIPEEMCTFSPKARTIIGEIKDFTIYRCGRCGMFGLLITANTTLVFGVFT